MRPEIYIPIAVGRPDFVVVRMVFGPSRAYPSTVGDELQRVYPQARHGTLALVISETRAKSPFRLAFLSVREGDHWSPLALIGPGAAAALLAASGAVGMTDYMHEVQ